MAVRSWRSLQEITMPAPKGYSLHIGLNFVDPAHYEGWDGELNACEADADDMETLAANAGYETEKLIREQATRATVTDAIRDLARRARRGDICLITYSGHGGQIPDLTGDERDSKDETWCLYDGQLLDDELELLWHQFTHGVRILLISDSCHSESIARTAMFMGRPQPVVSPFQVRTPPRAIIRRVYQTHRAAYDRIQLETKEALQGRSPRSLRCTVRTLSGCLDSEVSYDGDENGQFTAALLATWDFGRFDGDYARFHRDIATQVGSQQTPQHNVIGMPDPNFDAQRPFQIAPSAARLAGGAGARGEVELEIRVSGKDGIRLYGFAYAGSPVGMSGDRGIFRAVRNERRLLEWVMVGDPGGKMKVEVLRDGTPIETRESSEIVPPEIEGYDAFEIDVA
jgi:metacaspase-1